MVNLKNEKKLGFADLFQNLKEISSKISPLNKLLFLSLFLTLAAAPFILKTAQNLNINADVVPVCPSLPYINGSALGSVEKNGITSVSTTTQLTNSVDNFYLVAVSTKPNAIPTKITGLGLNWQPIKYQCSGRNQTQISLYKGVGVALNSGVITAYFNSFNGGAVIYAVSYGGVDTISPIGNVSSVNTVGINGLCTGGNDTSDYSYSFNTTVPSSVVFSAVAQRNRTHTPGFGFIEILDTRTGTGGDSAGIAAQTKYSPLPNIGVVNGKLSSAQDWASIAVELKKVSCPVSYGTTTPTALPTTTPNPIFCTADAKLCPDGSYVSRTGPNCEFAPCPTPTPKPTSTPTPTSSALSPAPLPIVNPPTSGIWLTKEEIAALPTLGVAWDKLKAAADSSWGSPLISDQNSNHDVNTLAGALVYARTGNSYYRTKVAESIMSAIGTEQGGRVLALARNLVSYVIAADLIDLKSYDAAKEQTFRNWLSTVRTESMTECTNLISCHNTRPNNWGMHSGASRVAADIYLGDKTDLAKAAAVFKGWLGDRASYASFSYGDLSWQCNSSLPVGINPRGCTKNGQNIDGVLPDDQRRSGGFVWPAPKENYVYEALQGGIVEAVLLYRAGYTDVFNWNDQAILRAYNWLYYVNNFSAASDDAWQIYLVNRYYKTSFPVSVVNPGKNMGWTDWTHPK